MYKNENVTPSSISLAPRVTFFAYSGHGINYGSTDNAIHTNYTKVAPVPHILTEERTDTSFNKLTTETIFNHKYVVLYTCNQLTNDGSTTKANNILKMMNGTRLMFGFASVMYLDSREAKRFTELMESKTIVNAFFDAAKYYQKQRDSGDSIARVVGYGPAENDRITGSYSYAPSAPTNLSSFRIIRTVVVPHTGERL